MPNPFDDRSPFWPSNRSVGFTGGGPVAQIFTPTFAGAGASIEVHFLNQNQQDVFTKTYTLSATPTGILGIGTFSSDLLSIKPRCPEGFIAYARSGTVTVGRTGSQAQDLNWTTYSNAGVEQTSQPETMDPGDALHWGLVAGSNGWKIYRNESSSSGATPVIPGQMNYVTLQTGEAIATPNTSEIQIFKNAPAGTAQVLLTIRGFPLTITTDNNATPPTAGAHGQDWAVTTVTPYVIPLTQAAALRWWAIQNGGASTGWIEFQG